MFESKKLPGIRPIPIELEVGRQTPSECAQPLQEFVATGLAGHFQFASIGDANFNIVALFQFQCFYDLGGKTNRKAVAPFRDLHASLHRYTIVFKYILSLVAAKTNKMHWRKRHSRSASIEATPPASCGRTS